MASSKELHVQASVLRARASVGNDKALFWMVSALLVAVVGGFAGVVTLVDWYSQYTFKAGAVPVNATVAPILLWAAFCVVTCALATAGVYMARVAQWQKQARILGRQAAKAALEEQALERRKAQTQREKAQAEALEEEWKEVAAKRLAEEKLKAAPAVAKQIDDFLADPSKSVRDRRPERKGGPNKLGGPRT